MNEELNPYEAATVERNVVAEPEKRKIRTWHPVAILLIPIVAANATFWLIVLFASLSMKDGLSGLVFGLYATPVIGLLYGLSLGSYLFFVRRIQKWFYFPLVMGIFQGLWFFGCMTGGCMIIGQFG